MHHWICKMGDQRRKGRLRRQKPGRIPCSAKRMRGGRGTWSLLEVERTHMTSYLPASGAQSCAAQAPSHAPLPLSEVTPLHVTAS